MAVLLYDNFSKPTYYARNYTTGLPFCQAKFRPVSLISCKFPHFPYIAVNQGL